MRLIPNISDQKIVDLYFKLLEHKYLVQQVIPEFGSFDSLKRKHNIYLVFMRSLIIHKEFNKQFKKIPKKNKINFYLDLLDIFNKLKAKNIYINLKL